MDTESSKAMSICVNQYSSNSSFVFPGTLVPESALLFVLVAPFLPIAFLRAKSKKEK